MNLLLLNLTVTVLAKHMLFQRMTTFTIVLRLSILCPVWWRIGRSMGSMSVSEQLKPTPSPNSTLTFSCCQLTFFGLGEGCSVDFDLKYTRVWWRFLFLSKYLFYPWSFICSLFLFVDSKEDLPKFRCGCQVCGMRFHRWCELRAHLNAKPGM